MRLDHLLSTEFFRTPVWRPSCGPRAGDRLRFGVGVLVWKIVGFAGSLGGRRGVVRICFWVPGPPPATWSRAVFRMPLAGRRRPCGPRVGSGRGAWWFENWIVDASNAGLLSCLLYRDFARLFFWSLVSRSIVL